MSTRDSVLKELKNNRRLFLSGEELSSQLGVSRAAVWKAIKILREDGYRIEAATNRGYRLLKGDEDLRLSEDGVRRALPPALEGNRIIFYDVTDSTNLRARQLLLDCPGGRTHGTVVLASQQTAGRGRLGRNFFSPDAGIYLSIIIRPDFDMSKSILVTVAAATAVAEAIENVCGQDAEIKWVNDIYVDGKKVCGILTEATTNFETGQIENLIIGIGINTGTEGFPEDLLQTAGAVSGDYTASQLAASVIVRTLQYVEGIGKGTNFIDEYRRRSFLVGRNVTVYKGTYRQDPSGELGGIEAFAVGIDDVGGLIVRYENGIEETLTTGEVSVRM